VAQVVTRTPPTGVSRWLFRIPIGLYRLRLGWLLGDRFLLLHHIGRKSGLPRQAVVEVVTRNGACFVIASGFGEQSQWYQNVMAHPDLDITFGTRRVAVHAQRLGVDEASEAMRTYTREHPKAAARLASYMGFHGPDAVEQVAHEIPFVELCPR
jgi:deazaflavin-dependent oxidoreductase (nitroreductase family)